MEKEGLIMYKNDDTRQLYLIKPTGAVEALPKKYVDATNFVDGIAAVATATSGLGFFLSWTFIDRSLKPFAPGVVTQPRQFGKINPPLLRFVTVCVPCMCLMRAVSVAVGDS